MDSDRHKTVVLAVLGFLLGASMVVAGAHIAGVVPISGGAPLVAPDGMAVTVNGDTNANLEDPFTGSGTVSVVTEAGNATFYSAGPANATIHKDDIEGSTTLVTDIDASSNTVQIDPEDKSQVTVGKQTTLIEWTGSYAADDGTQDFNYEATGGDGRVTINGAPASTELYAIDQTTNDILGKATSDSSGTVTFDTLDSGDHDVVLQTNVNDAPTLSNASPQGGQSSEPTQFSVDVGDKNFDQGDTVTVSISFEGSEVHSETISSNSTVTASIPAEGQEGGTHSWSVEATDDFGGSTSASYQYSVPTTLEFRSERPDHALVTGTDTNPVTIEAIFFEDAESDPVIIDKSTTDGTIELDGLPVGSEFSVSVSAPGYNNRTVRIESIYEQNEVFLLEKGVSPTVENRFVVNDNTGNFPAEDTQIAIQGPVNETKYDTSADGFAWKTVSGDDLGADESFVDDLEQEKRYRIIITNDDGDRRNLGSYTPEVSGTIELNIGSLNADETTTDGVGYNVTYRNQTNGQDIKIEYNDTADATDEIRLDIYERNNESNKLVDNETFSGPFGTFAHIEPIPQQYNETTWVVELHGVRGNGTDGEPRQDVQIQQYAGPGFGVLSGLPPWLVTVIFVGMIWGVAGMFSQINGHVGGIVVAGLGAMFYFVGLVPGYLGGGVVGLSLLTAGILFIRGSRGGGL